MRRFHHSQGTHVVKEWAFRRAQHFGPKIAWFVSKGYEPHAYQLAFHTMCDDDTQRVLMNRMLVAGRRGGKTLSAAWEVAYYCLHPEAWHWDVHKRDDDSPIHVWVLVPNFKTAGRAAMRTFESVLKKAGLHQGHGYKWNKGENYVEFDNGSFLEFKTAEQADNLVGAGIHILWMDEFAIITSQDAFDYASPALDDNQGIVIGTSTPRGKNWAFDLFFGPEAQEQDFTGSVEYTSIHNPFFSRERWELRRKTFHPLRFKQEYMAAFDSMAGKELHGAWLHYYEWSDVPLRDAEKGHFKTDSQGNTRLRLENLKLNYYVGVDPAISLNDKADRFALAVLGVTEDNSQAYLIDLWAGRIPFPEQVQLIQEYHLRYRPIYIGVESQAYQASLVQQLQRLSTMPPVMPQRAVGKKAERLLSMAPSFKIGRVLIRNEHRDFIDEWVGYDSDMKNPKDDTLDAVEIALRTAGILLPGFELPDTDDIKPAGDVDELAHRLMPATHDANKGYDEHMGMEW